MNKPQVEVSRVIDAPPAVIYAIIADYRNSHPRILPKPEFAEMVVEQGGTGAGTVIRVTMQVMGSRQTSRLTVSEPEPGRVIQEEDAGLVTTFTVTPLEDGRRSQVTIATAWRKPGLVGVIERLINPLVARGLYRRELELLAAEAEKE
jgi:hypothetical protein